MRTECIIQERRVEVDADYVVEKLRTMVEDPNCPASSQVQALGLLARHLGMLNDKIDINDSLVMRRLYGVPLQSRFHPKAQLNKDLPIVGKPFHAVNNIPIHPLVTCSRAY